MPPSLQTSCTSHHMASFVVFIASAFILVASLGACARLVEHTFNVENVKVRKLCKDREITTVNGRSPGPLLQVQEGDTLFIHVLNNSPYNVTIHWHGVFQRLSAWADGPVYTTQCPIQQGNSYTYRFNVTGQEGTLWWHAHVNSLRATVYGGLIIHPRNSYPFPNPYMQFPIILGEWWDENVMGGYEKSLASGGAPNNSDAYLINGKPGDRYSSSSSSCSINSTYKIEVVQGKTYMLRIINAAVNNQLFFTIAGHKMKVVAVDASYTHPYETDVVLVAPGQTTDVLVTADQPVGSYYMAAGPYASAINVSFNNKTATAILRYQGSSSMSMPKTAKLPDSGDMATAFKFTGELTGLVGGPFWQPVPARVDEHMLMTIGLGLVSCGPGGSCGGPLGQRLGASVSNFSLRLPTRISMLEARYYRANGVYNVTFPDFPLVQYDYTNVVNALNGSLVMTAKSTTIKKLKYNSTVEIVFQDTAVLGTESHPMHIHGLNFYVVGQGFGNFDSSKDRKKFNLVNPLVRNTIGVPAGGWAAVRFRADNPGVWLLHCHLDVHLAWGLGTALLIEDGGTPLSTLPGPPSDLPQC